MELTAYDSKFYTEPLHYQRSWIANPKGKTRESACTENNTDVTAGHLGFGPGPIRADGTRGYNVSTLPENPPGPEAYGVK